MILYHGSYLEIPEPDLQICFRTEKALDFFYHSEVYQLMRDGVSDMHCMSDAYLEEELEQEYCQVSVMTKRRF